MGHNVILLTKLKSQVESQWYAAETLKNGWSRNVLVAKIESNLYLRKDSAITNSTSTLSAPQSELAQQLIKDPYVLDFMTLMSRKLMAIRQSLNRNLERCIDRYEILDHIHDIAFLRRFLSSPLCLNLFDLTSVPNSDNDEGQPLFETQRSINV